MKNFTYKNPTEVIFGQGVIGELAKKLPHDKKVLMIYGGGSIKLNGVYDQVKTATQGFDLLEFGGIEPNPHYETCMKAVELIKREKIEYLLAVGGGSVLDATKFISAAACYRGDDPWDMIIKGLPVEDALPLADVITLPATGSEMNSGAVISRISTGEKYAIIDPKLFPQFSIIDPSVCCSLPMRQTINGIVDTYVHICEQVMTFDVNSPVVDRMAFAVLRVLTDEGPKAIKNPTDFEVRQNLFWASTVGLNGWLGTGVVQDWSVHMIGHELTAIYGLDHAQTLAIVLPKIWRFHFLQKEKKLAALAREVYAVTALSDKHAAELAISETVKFFQSLGMKTTLSDYGINAKEAGEKIAERFTKTGVHHSEYGDVDGSTVAGILQL